MDRIASTTRLMALSADASLDLVDTESGEILSTVPLIDVHSRGGQYLGLLDVGQHLEAGVGVVAISPPQRCRTMVPENIFESGANPDYAPTDLQKIVMRQDAQMRQFQERQLDLERQMMVREAVARNQELEAQRAANPPVADPLEPSPTEANPVVE